MSKCLGVPACTSYVWKSQDDAGVCFLKGGPVDKMDAVPDTSDADSVCGVIPLNSPQDAGTFCSFDGEAVGQVLVPQEQCADACRKAPKCSHFVWTETEDGTCFFKRANLPMSSAKKTRRFSACGLVREKIAP